MIKKGVNKIRLFKMEKGYYKRGFVLNYSGSQGSESSETNNRSIDAELIADRCRISIEGKNNMICIEGHPTRKRNKSTR